MAPSFSLYGTGLTSGQHKALSALGFDVKKFDRIALPAGSVLVGPKFDGQNLGPDYVPVRLYEPGETDRGKYLYEVNLGNGQRIRQLFHHGGMYLLNQQRAHRYALSLKEAEDILHWGDRCKPFQAIKRAWGVGDCTLCSEACLEILTARSLDMIRYRCPDPAVLLDEFKDSRWMSEPGPYMTIHARGCWECRDIVDSLEREADDIATRKRLAKFFVALSEGTFSAAGNTQFDCDGLTAEITLDNGSLEVWIKEDDAHFSSPDRLQMVVERLDGTSEVSSDNDPNDVLHFFIGSRRMKMLPFKIKIIPAEKPEP